MTPPKITVIATMVVLSVIHSSSAQENDTFTRLDKDKDGKLLRAETPERLHESFDAMDANKDSVLTREEFDARQRRGKSKPSEQRTLEPTHADVPYGQHERNVLDLYLAKSDKPTPLVLYIHGGGFLQGDKRTLNAREAKSFLDQGWSVAAINYRFSNMAPAPAAYLDCARALQFLRHNASKWNLDPQLVASTGGSAGAGTSMWIAFHDDLADPDGDDPIARESTRLVCVAVNNGQSSYDPRFAERIGMPRPNFERNRFFLPFYDLNKDDIDTPEAYRRYEEMAPITYLTKDDPPALLMYSYVNEEVTKDSSNDLVVHHPKLGIALKERMDELGIECIVQYREKDGRTVRHKESDPPIRATDFIRRHFEKAVSSTDGR